jgi:hypothetical protein
MTTDDAELFEPRFLAYADPKTLVPPARSCRHLHP